MLSVVKLIIFCVVVGVAGAGGKEAAVLRGPVVSRVINQLVGNTEWGELDYLVSNPAFFVFIYCIYKLESA